MILVPSILLPVWRNTINVLRSRMIVFCQTWRRIEVAFRISELPFNKSWIVDCTFVPEIGLPSCLWPVGRLKSSVPPKYPTANTGLRHFWISLTADLSVRFPSPHEGYFRHLTTIIPPNHPNKAPTSKNKNKKTEKDREINLSSRLSTVFNNKIWSPIREGTPIIA